MAVLVLTVAPFIRSGMIAASGSIAWPGLSGQSRPDERIEQEYSIETWWLGSLSVRGKCDRMVDFGLPRRGATRPHGAPTFPHTHRRDFLRILRTDIPFAPRRWPFFYGWVIVVASTVGILASIPGQTMGVGVFTDSLLATLHLTPTQLSTAYMLGTIASSLLLPFAGSLLDRIGARAMVVLAAAGLGASVMALSLCGRVVHSFGGDPVLSAMAVIFLCFLLVRFFGQGCLTMASRVALSKWFNHRRGLATAVSGIFVSFGFSASPRLLNNLVGWFGWQGACLVLAVAVGVGVSVFGWVFFRDNPEACGLVMDGIEDEHWHRRMAARIPETRKEFTQFEAMRTIAFWVFNVGVASQALIITALTFHIASLGREMGLTRDESYAVFLPMAVFSVGATFLSGWISDRVRLKWILVVMMMAEAIGTCGLLSFADAAGRWMLIGGYGVAGGIFATLTTVVWPRFYGREHLGAISGMNMSIMVFASAIGPVLFAEAKEMTGSYLEIGLICWLMPVAILLACAWAENPQEQFEPET